MRTNPIFLASVALGAAVALALSGCSGSGSQAAGSSGAGSQEAGKGKITFIGVEGDDALLSPTLLWKHVLEEQGYDIEITYIQDAVAYSALANGDADVFTTAWLPVTQGEYYKKYADQIEKLVVWNDEATLTLAVNEDAPIDSLDELSANAAAFDNKIIGIEAGTGLDGVVQSRVIPNYGLEDMEYITSSTTAMLGDLKSKTDAGKNVLVTLWQPHWAYGAYPLKNLKDPKGALGAAEELTTLTRTGFAEEYPEVAGWMKDWKMDTETLSSLQVALFQDNDASKYDERLDKWINEHGDYVKGLTG